MQFRVGVPVNWPHLFSLSTASVTTRGLGCPFFLWPFSTTRRTATSNVLSIRRTPWMALSSAAPLPLRHFWSTIQEISNITSQTVTAWILTVFLVWLIHPSSMMAVYLLTYFETTTHSLRRNILLVLAWNAFLLPPTCSSLGLSWTFHSLSKSLTSPRIQRIYLTLSSSMTVPQLPFLFHRWPI
jgi:hypothetical protein